MLISVNASIHMTGGCLGLAGGHSHRLGGGYVRYVEHMLTVCLVYSRKITKNYRIKCICPVYTKIPGFPVKSMAMTPRHL
jgi:hypothetical protein